MNCRDRCATDEYDSVIRRLEAAENKNLDQDNAIDNMGKTIPDFYEVDTLKIDVGDLKNDVVILSNEKLDKEYIDKDLHFGEITLVREGTAVMAQLDVHNPVTGVTKPISFTIPGATASLSGVMPANAVTWIDDAEERISMLEGLSDVNGVEGLSGDPSQSELTTGWVDASGKPPEKGDILQDLDNGKLWVFGGVDWTLMGETVYMPTASTTNLGGVRDTSLTAEGNRWYVHVENDGRMALIGGDSLSTLLDTTIPVLQAELDEKADSSALTGHTGNVSNPHKVTKAQVGLGAYPASPADIGISTATQTALDGKVNNTGLVRLKHPSGAFVDIGTQSSSDDRISAFVQLRHMVDGVLTYGEAMRWYGIAGSVYVKVVMRDSPASTDAVNTKYVLDQVTGMVDYVDGEVDAKADKGGAINVGDEIIQKDIDPRDWQQCETPNTTNFVCVSGPARGLNALISETGSGVAGMYTRVAGIGDVGNESGSSSISFLVPKNWYYKIETPGSTSSTPRAVEHPITL